MATSELGDWHVGKITLTAETAELVLFEQSSGDDNVKEMVLLGFVAILALRDLIDEEVARAEQRSEMETDSNVQEGLTPADDSGTL